MSSIDNETEANIEQVGSENEEYEVESVLASRTTPKGKEYLVKWKDYSEDQATWEKRRNLEHCSALIYAFEAHASKAETAKSHQNSPSLKRKNLETTYEEVTKRLKSLIRSKVPEKEELETLLKQLNKAETVQEKEAILLICNEKLEAVESAQIIEIQNLSEQSEDSDIVLTSPTPLARNTHSEQNNALTTPKNSMKSHTANGSERVTRSGKKIDTTAPNSSSKIKRRNISSVESFQHEKKEDPVTVVRILAHQISGNGKPRYQAEWSNGHTSWLHDREIDDHLDLIEDFEHSEYSKENPQSSADVTSSSLHSFDSYQNDPFITSFQDPAFFIDVPQLPLPHTDYVWYPEVSVIIDVEPTEPNESVEQQDFKPSDGESSPNMSDASDTTDSEMEEESDDLTPKVRNYQRLTKRTRNSNKIMGSDSEELKSVNHSKRLRIEDSSSDELSSEPQRRSQRKLFHRVVPPGEQQFYADAGKTVRDLDEEYMEVDEEINTSDPEENDDSIQAHCYQCGKKGEIPLRIEPDSKSNFLLPCHRCSYVAHKQCYVEAFDEPYEDGFNTEIVDNETSSRRKRRITIWKCHDCQVWPKDVEKILTFRYLDEEKEHNLIEDWENESGTDILYLVKFKTLSYHHVEWVTSRWLFDVSPALLRAFIKKNPESQPPEKVIRKEWTLVDRLLDVRFKDKVSIGHATPDDVDAMFAKWQNLPYDEATWDDPPKAGSEEYDHYAQAFRKFIKKCQVKVPSRHSQKSTGKFIELKKQPSYLKGGELMPFQLEGVNWLLYKWLDQSSCILADEMGLGKTVQIIAFLSILFNARAVFPFLIVVPNSVLANWLMEFSKWEPELVVATYSGSSASRKLIRKYEMFQEGSNSQLRCHVVITTYEMIIQETAVFKKNFWEVLVVDEGHKLKNETNKFFTKLSEVKAGHKVILTGTPLQNNIRELFNLLSFIDPKSFKMKAELEEKYEHLSKDLVGELHELVKPYILRRTKAEVLTTLPSKHEVIVPVSMTLLQKEIYKGILGRNYQLLKSITGKNSKSNQKKSSMLNILMELRKCLNHPYLINGVEETFTSLEETQIRLIEASGKMALLDRLLKKLKEQGHRVLIFSQFQIMLDILEDYLVCEDYKFLRIDGSTVGEVRQQYIDAFNKPDSDYFVFLLSTRAGGVGLNLATADTVIIFDPDFNPHADMQAISRAHRIGQKNTVLVLKLVTKNSAEQKIMEVAKTKLVLDHLVIERLDDDDMDTTDVESILKFGAKALFDEENNPGLAETRTIKYDDSALEQLLERANCEPDPSSTPRIADSSGGAFSFARVWVNDNGTEDSETQDENYWDNILKDRLAESRKEDAVEYGRGARRTKKIHYSEQLDATPSESVPKNKSRMIRMPEDKEYENVVLSESESETMDDIEKDELPVQNPAEPTAVPPATSASKTSVSQKPTLWQLKPQNFVNLPAPNSITGTQQPYAPTSSISQAYSPSAVPISQLSELNDISNIPRLVSIRQALLNRYTNYHNSLANANQPLQQGQPVGLPSTSTNISSQQTQATSLPGSTTPATVFRSPQQSQVASLPNSTVPTVAYISPQKTQLDSLPDSTSQVATSGSPQQSHVASLPGSIAPTTAYRSPQQGPFVSLPGSTTPTATYRSPQQAQFGSLPGSTSQVTAFGSPQQSHVPSLPGSTTSTTYRSPQQAQFGSLPGSTSQVTAFGSPQQSHVPSLPGSTTSTTYRSPQQTQFVSLPGSTMPTVAYRSPQQTHIGTLPGSSKLTNAYQSPQQTYVASLPSSSASAATYRSPQQVHAASLPNLAFNTSTSHNFQSSASQFPQRPVTFVNQPQANKQRLDKSKETQHNFRPVNYNQSLPNLNQQNSPQAQMAQLNQMQYQSRQESAQRAQLNQLQHLIKQMNPNPSGSAQAEEKQLKQMQQYQLQVSQLQQAQAEKPLPDQVQHALLQQMQQYHSNQPQQKQLQAAERQRNHLKQMQNLLNQIQNNQTSGAHRQEQAKILHQYLQKQIQENAPHLNQTQQTQLRQLQQYLLNQMSPQQVHQLQQQYLQQQRPPLPLLNNSLQQQLQQSLQHSLQQQPQQHPSQQQLQWHLQQSLQQQSQQKQSSQQSQQPHPQPPQKQLPQQPSPQIQSPQRQSSQLQQQSQQNQLPQQPLQQQAPQQQSQQGIIDQTPVDNTQPVIILDDEPVSSPLSENPKNCGQSTNSSTSSPTITKESPQTSKIDLPNINENNPESALVNEKQKYQRQELFKSLSRLHELRRERENILNGQIDDSIGTITSPKAVKQNSSKDEGNHAQTHEGSPSSQTADGTNHDLETLQNTKGANEVGQDTNSSETSQKIPDVNDKDEVTQTISNANENNPK